MRMFLCSSGPSVLRNMFPSAALHTSSVLNRFCCFSSILSACVVPGGPKLDNDPASCYTLTPIIPIKVITPWIFRTTLLVMHLEMRLALFRFVIALGCWNSTHSKSSTAVSLSRQVPPGLCSHIWFSVKSVMSCPYWNSRCLLTTCLIY